MCANNDTEFWKYNMSKPIPENLKNYIDLAKLGALRSDHLSEYPTTVMFSVLSFNQVLYGLGHIEPDLCKKTLLNRMNPEDIINRNIWGRIKLTPLQEELKPHREILDFIVQQGTFEWAQDKADQKKQAENSQ